MWDKVCMNGLCFPRPFVVLREIRSAVAKAEKSEVSNIRLPLVMFHGWEGHRWDCFVVASALAMSISARLPMFNPFEKTTQAGTVSVGEDF